MWYNEYMDINDFVLDIFDAVAKTYAVVRNKPYATGQILYIPQKGKSGEITKEEIALTVINEAGPQMEVKRVWFLTSFNRPVFSQYVDSRMPIKLRKKDRATYFVPIEEFKAALNKSIKETITKTVVLDATERQYAASVDKATQQQLAK